MSNNPPKEGQGELFTPEEMNGKPKTEAQPVVGPEKKPEFKWAPPDEDKKESVWKDTGYR